MEETRVLYRDILRVDLLHCPALATPDLAETIGDAVELAVRLAELTIDIRNASCEDGDYERHMIMTGEFAKRLESLGNANVVNTFSAGILADAVSVSGAVMALASAAGTA